MTERDTGDSDLNDKGQLGQPHGLITIELNMSPEELQARREEFIRDLSLITGVMPQDISLTIIPQSETPQSD